MKATLYKNIELVRIPVKAGVSEYYFPQNVSWADETIERIVPVIPQTACVDPMDGSTPIMDGSLYKDLFFNIYSADQKELLHACSCDQLVHTNNNPIALNSKLDLSLCNLYFTDDPTTDCTLLLYVYHGNREVEIETMPARSITVEFELQAGEEINFQEIIQQYIHALPAKVKGVLMWNAITAPAYFTLRDNKLQYMLQNLHSELARPQMNGGSAADTQLAPMLFDNIDINFQYSHIRNCGSSAAVQKMTILY